MAVAVAMVVTGMTPTGTAATSAVTIVAMTAATAMTAAPTVATTEADTVMSGPTIAETGTMGTPAWIGTLAVRIVIAMDPAVMTAVAVGTNANGMTVLPTGREADLATLLLPHPAMATRPPVQMLGITRPTRLTPR